MPVVVLLHGFGGSARSWRAVVDALGDQTCVAPDLRGFGDRAAEEGAAQAVTVEAYTDDVAALVAAFDGRDYVLVGHSMGGKIAAAFAARQPTGLCGVLLVAPSPPWPEPMTADDRARLHRAHGDPTLAAGAVRRATAIGLSPVQFADAVDDGVRSASWAWQGWLDTGSREDLSSRIGHLAIPVRVLVGRRDPVMARPMMAQVARHLGGTLRVESEAGHLLPLEAPTTVVDAIRELLTAVAAGPPIRPAAAYPDGTTRALLATDHLTPATRRVLRERLDASDGLAVAPRFFDAHEFRSLTAACDRLIPQHGRRPAIPLANALDDRLADRAGNGWRYATMPPDPLAYRLGLRGLDETARALLDAPTFVALTGAQQDAVLGAVQDGAVTGGAWAEVSPTRFFEEFLADVAEAYYSHPAAQDEIGYAGYADAHGWQAVSLGARTAYEPRPVGPEDGR